MFDEKDVIFAYSRKQAIEDGVLIDVSDTAREAGIKFPVALTSAVFQGYVQVPEGLTNEDEDGRLWDLLWMLFMTICSGPKDTSEIRFAVLVRNTYGVARPVKLKAVCGPDDDANPCITIMLPDED